MSGEEAVHQELRLRAFLDLLVAEIRALDRRPVQLTELVQPAPELSVGRSRVGEGT